MEIFKYNSPKSVSNLLIKSSRAHIITLNLPNINLEKTKHNFLFSAILNWNNLTDHVFENCVPLSSGPNTGVVVPGSAENSDVSATVASIKSRVKNYILTQQNAGDIHW